MYVVPSLRFHGPVKEHILFIYTNMVVVVVMRYRNRCEVLSELRGFTSANCDRFHHRARMSTQRKNKYTHVTDRDSVRSLYTQEPMSLQASARANQNSDPMYTLYRTLKQNNTVWVHL